MTIKEKNNSEAVQQSQQLQSLWCHFTNPFQIIITWSIIPGLKGVASGIHSCAVLIALIVGLSVIPEPETNDGLLC